MNRRDFMKLGAGLVTAGTTALVGTVGATSALPVAKILPSESTFAPGQIWWIPFDALFLPGRIVVLREHEVHLGYEIPDYWRGRVYQSYWYDPDTVQLDTDQYFRTWQPSWLEDRWQYVGCSGQSLVHSPRAAWTVTDLRSLLPGCDWGVIRRDPTGHLYRARNHRWTTERILKQV